MNRPTNPDLTRAEWVNLVTVVVTKIGKGTAKGILRNALGEERANLLIEDQEGPRLSKDDNRAIIAELYHHIPVESRAAKKMWVLDVGKQVFGDTERFSEILDYAEHRVTEHEAAGGTIDHMPPEDQNDEAFFRSLKWLRNDPNGANAKVTRELRLNGISATRVDIEFDDIRGWPNGQWGAETKAVMCAAVRNGDLWEGGKFEHVRPVQPNRDFGNISPNYLDIRPVRGETIRFWLLSYDGREASNTVEAVWQAGIAPEPEPTPEPIFTWNGTNEIRLHPSLRADRLYLSKHTQPNGQKYPWQGENAQYHQLIEMHRPPPANGVIKIKDPSAIAREGIVQICHDNASMRPISMCWLIRPNVPAVSHVTEAQWRAGRTDGVILPFGRNG